MPSDVERLNLDLGRDERLLRELTAVAGRAEDVDRWLESRGYRLNEEELAQVSAALGEELCDEDLDPVSGGAGDSLALQNSLDRRSRLLTTMSNIMGATSGTADTLIDNLK